MGRNRYASLFFAAQCFTISLAAGPLSASAETSAPSESAASPEGSHDDVERARVHFRRGVELHQQGNLQAAYAEFLRAQEAAPHYQVSFNLAQTAFSLGYYADAQREFEKYLSSGGAQVNAERRQQVDEKLAQLAQLLGWVEVECSEIGASLLVDGRVIGTCPLRESVAVAAGRHGIALEGVTPRQRTVDVAVGERQKVTFSTSSLNAEMAAESGEKPNHTEFAQELPDPSEAQGPGSGFWWGMGAATALGVGAATTGILALTQSSQAQDAADQLPADPEKISSANNRASAFALTSDILLGAAVVTAGATLIFAWPLGSTQQKSHPADTRAELPSHLTWGLGVQSLHVSGQF